jgi:phosphatidylethanolamine-binding protein (PEBP) family uncharacterized protein
MADLVDGPAFTYSPLGALKDAEDYLGSVGIAGDKSLSITPLGDLQMLNVQYEDGKEGKESRGVMNGMDFQYEKREDLFLQQKPKVGLANIFTGTMSTLIMIDPDAPERKGPDKAGDKGPWLHWMITDIGTTTKGKKETRDIVNGNEKVPYSTPAPNKGKHRYIFIEFIQTGDLKLDSLERAKWDLKGFYAKNKKVLTPIAINFMYVSADREAAAAPPNPPHKTGNAGDKEWYATHQENLDKYGEAMLQGFHALNLVNLMPYGDPNQATRA